MFFLCQVDKELATGEFFLRDSVKKRKKMVEIKVSSKTPPNPPLHSEDICGFKDSFNEMLCFLSRPNRLRRRPRSRKSGTKPLSLPKRSRC